MPTSEHESAILDTNAVAEYLGMSVANWKRWVWTHPEEERRCPPDGYVGRSPYWHRATIDTWRATHYRAPGHPAGAEHAKE